MEGRRRRSCAWGTFQHPANPVLTATSPSGSWSSPARAASTGPSPRPNASSAACRPPPPSPVTSSWRPPPTSGRSRPRAPPASVTRRRSPSSCHAGSSSSTPTKATWCSTRSWVRAARPSPQVGRVATSSSRHRPRVHRSPRAGCPANRSGSRPSGDQVGVGAIPRSLRGRLPRLLGRRGRARGDARDPLAVAVVTVAEPAGSGEILLGQCGFDNIRSRSKPRGLGIVLSFVAADRTGADWAFDVSGTFTATGPASVGPTRCGSRSARRRCCTSRTSDDGVGIPLVLLTAMLSQGLGSPGAEGAARSGPACVRRGRAAGPRRPRPAAFVRGERSLTEVVSGRPRRLSGVRAVGLS